MDRRKFLQLGAFSALASAGLGSMVSRAATSDYKAAVCIFLAGGCDGNSLLIPGDDLGYANYAAGRATLAIPRAQLLPISPRSGGTYGLHPAMPELQGLFNQGRLAVLANVGTLVQPTTKDQANSGNWPLPDNLMSHIDQQNQWVTLDPTMPPAITGWGGRLADAIMTANAGARFPAVVSTAGSNLFCDATNAASTAINSDGEFGFPGNSGSDIDNARFAALSQILKDNSDSQLQGAYSNGVSATVAQSNLVANAINMQLNTVFPQTEIGQQLFRVAQFIASRNTFGLSRQIFYVELDGFDTHADQTATLNDLFSQLSQAMSAFHQATTELGVTQNVVTFTHSEFSRTFKPAGDNGDGADHAWGGHSLILGGPVKGGDLYGTFPQLTLSGPDDMTDEGRWVPTTSVDQYAATIASWMGVGDSDLVKVLPNLVNFQQKRLNFL